ncbi:MAG: heparinase II/III family protein [Deferrisomatales bacterium]|nr:heparinase II/III family protein [Deferrisomatales bacterium]
MTLHPVRLAKGTALALAAPGLVIAGLLWAPVVVHYRIPEPKISRADIAASREQPSEELFSELQVLSFGVPRTEGLETDQLLAAADRLFHREFSLPGWEPRPIGVPFEPGDLVSGPGVWQLRYASFLLPGILLDAFERTGDDAYLLAARDFFLDWYRFERSLWIPRGFIWNDHAVAARVIALANFWRLYRGHPAFRDADAEQFLKLVARTGNMLAHPKHYTFATNHGTFQTLALFHLALSFPALPPFELYPALARERLAEQMEYLVAPDGAVLEHSAEYHHSGLERMTTAFRYMTLAGMPIPANWQVRYEKAKALHAALIRPDGSLPRLGDTKVRVAAGGTTVTQVNRLGEADRPVRQREWAPADPFTLCPVGGFAAWWQSVPGLGAPGAAGAQTVVNWSHFPGYGHQQADELSVNAWAGGVEWLTGTGYWPYGGPPPGRAWALSWGGSNAPHLQGEARDSDRASSVLGHASSPLASAVEVQRENRDGFRVRRQVITLSEGFWVIVDSFEDPVARPVETLWTFDPQMELSGGPADQPLRLLAAEGPVGAAAWFLGSDGHGWSVHRGSLDPAAGWAIDAHNKARPAFAVRVDQRSSGSWSAVVFWLHDVGSPAEVPPNVAMEHWAGPSDWGLVVGQDGGPLRFTRAGNELTLSGGNLAEADQTVELRPGPEVSAERERIDRAFAAAGEKYGPKFRESRGLRVRLTVALLYLLLAQEVFFFVYGRFTERYRMPLRIAAAAAWVATGLAIHARYFA